MILIVDDDRAICASLKMLLSHAGYECHAVTSPSEAIDIVRRQRPGAVMLDMNFSRHTSGDEGLTLLRQIKIFSPDVPVILMTAWGSIGLAVAGMKAGAFDFVTKPWDNRQLLKTIGNAIELSRHHNDDPTDNNGDFDRCGIVGNDPALCKILDTVSRIATTSATVLITGESGTGKELIAEAIHRNSPRRDKPFVKVNLGGLSQSLFESEMFGHIKGAFTDAVTNRTGRFEAADGGTIFLDEIGELDLSCQVKLLRVLQEQRFEPLGSSKTRKIDVRVICATNADLPSMVAAHTFREDLFYRINLITLELPPLRHRIGDLMPLAHHFVAEAASRYGFKEPVLDPSVKDFHSRHTFPGNLREMKNLIERVLLVNRSETLSAEDFDRETSPSAKYAETVAGSLEDIERKRIQTALDSCGGNLSRAAVELGLSRQALYRRIEKYGLRI